MPALVPLALAATLLAPSAATDDGWLRPVPGEAVRAFDYGARSPFTEGQHRGADLAAPPGRAVRSACTGVVVFAGRTPGHGRTVSVRCGRRRVAFLPLRDVRVRRGQAVARGQRLGRVAPGHGGGDGALHVGVRREGRRFAYVDPLGLFGDVAATVPPPVPRAGPPPRRGPPRTPTPRPVPRPSPRTAPAPAPVGAPAPAPWPVWLGLTLLLLGATGGTTLAARRRRTQSRRVPVALRRPA